MKSEVAVPVLVAVIAALASVAGVLYNQHGALKLEREKWRQSVLDDKNKREREALTAFAKEFSAAYHLAENFLWRIEMTSSSLTEKDFADYAKASDLLKPKLAAVEVQLAATSHAHYIRVAPLLKEYRRIDEQIVVAGPRFEKERSSVLSLLDAEVKKLNDFQQQMVNSLSTEQNGAAEDVIMYTSDKIQFATLLVAIISFVVTEAIGIHQRSKQDKRSDLKLRIFEILGSESKALEEIKEAIKEVHRVKWGQLATDELRKAIYEMLSEETAFYESTNKYRAHWRNPKGKDQSEPSAISSDRAVQLPPNPEPAADA